MTVFSATLLLFLVLDPVGNVPAFLCILKDTEPGRQRHIIIRELLIALFVLIFFMFVGRYILIVLRISEPALSISGGIILFLIAIRMIFSSVSEMFLGGPAGEPLIFPLAVPLIAGPSAVATVLLLMAREPHRWLEWLLAVVLAWFSAGVILLFCAPLRRLFGQRGLTAMERLMGMILTTVAVEMFISGVSDLVLQSQQF
jgi:MarC family membrane protein